MSQRWKKADGLADTVQAQYIFMTNEQRPHAQPRIPLLLWGTLLLSASLHIGLLLISPTQHTSTLPLPAYQVIELQQTLPLQPVQTKHLAGIPKHDVESTSTPQPAKPIRPATKEPSKPTIIHSTPKEPAVVPPESEVRSSPHTQHKTQPAVVSAGNLLAQMNALETAENSPLKNTPSEKTTPDDGNQNFIWSRYKEDWRLKVERIGNLNYPEILLRNNIHGKVRMDIVLNSDGSVRSVSTSNNSAHPELEQAAKHIIELSAPFAPLPAALIKNNTTRTLSIPFVFSKENRFLSN